MQHYLLLFIGVGILFIVVGSPLARRRISPNRWYGVRIRATFADPDVWYATNEAVGRDMILLGVVVVVLASLLPLVLSLRPPDYAGVLAGVVGLGSIVFTIRGFRLANRLLRERRGG